MVAVGVASGDGDPCVTRPFMRLKSLTKAITSVAALRLVEAGRLGLDQNLEDWLGSSPTDGC
ncbi:MAG: beta-lactamase family protein [Actinomycetota bacterium]|nr:beta-lactamase family protein [Actinomycetota bacterium]